MFSRTSSWRNTNLLLNIVNKSTMKVIKELSLSNFDFWGGAKDRAQMLTIDELDEIERQLEDVYPEGMDETQINDIFWFDFDWVAQMIGYEDEEDLYNQRNKD